MKVCNTSFFKKFTGYQVKDFYKEAPENYRHFLDLKTKEEDLIAFINNSSTT